MRSSFISSKIFVGALPVIFGVAFFLFLPSAHAQYARQETDEEYNEEMDQQLALVNAQSTMASLFGKNAVLAVPPQLAGGTIALPSVDVSKEKVTPNAGIEGADSE